MFGREEGSVIWEGTKPQSTGLRPCDHWMRRNRSWGSLGQWRNNWINGSDRWYDKVHWALLFHKRHLKGRGLLKAYKAHNPSIPWQCGTLNTLLHVWYYGSNTCTTWNNAQHCPRPWSSDIRIDFEFQYFLLMCSNVYKGKQVTWSFDQLSKSNKVWITNVNLI
jgi:hypothetical protein